jgi:AcrR family transcriptional regulator
MKHLIKPVEVSPPDLVPDARSRLLETALQLFSSKGLDATSVRELASAAGTNIAAVNYHFGSKEALHTEVLRYGFRRLSEIQPRLDALLEKARAEWTKTHSITVVEEGLVAFIHLFMTTVASPDQRCLLVFDREKLTPNPAVQKIIQEFFAPVGRVLSGFIALLLPGESQQTVMLTTYSVISQCVHLRNARPTIRHFAKREALDPEFVALMATHISTFTLAALRGMRQEKA